VTIDQVFPTIKAYLQIYTSTMLTTTCITYLILFDILYWFRIQIDCPYFKTYKWVL